MIAAHTRGPMEETPEADLTAQWKSLMAQGLQALRELQHARAESVFLQALELVRRMFLPAGAHGDAPAFDDDDRFAALVVTHLNLADSYAIAGEHARAAACLCEAHGVLASVLHDEHAPVHQQLAASRHLRETQSALLQFCAEHGEQPCIAEALNQTRTPGRWLH